MPAYIKTLKNTDGDIIYPQTKASAVFTNDGVNIESIFENPALIGGVFVPAEAKIVTLKDKDGEIIAPRTTTEAISDFPSIDTTPTYGSNNIVTSGGVANALIGKAPAGYGYGDIPITIRASSNNESYEAYCAKVDAVLSTMGGDGVKQVFAYPPQVYSSGQYVATLYKSDIDGLYASLTTTTTYSNANKTLGFTMRKLNGVWEPLEWINPPMLAGVEYRTTERFNGDLVYAKVVDCGNTPAANSTSQIVWFNDSNYNLGSVISFYAFRGYIGLINNFVVDQNAAIAGERIHLKTGNTLYYSGPVFAIVKYTKSAK